MSASMQPAKPRCGELLAAFGGLDACVTHAGHSWGAQHGQTAFSSQKSCPSCSDRILSLRQAGLVQKSWISFNTGGHELTATVWYIHFAAMGLQNSRHKLVINRNSKGSTTGCKGDWSALTASSQLLQQQEVLLSEATHPSKPKPLTYYLAM